MRGRSDLSVEDLVSGFIHKESGRGRGGSQGGTANSSLVASVRVPGGDATAALSRKGAGVDVPPHAAAAAVTSDDTVRPGMAGQGGRFPLAKLSVRLDR